jgi:hypothetical protein
MFLLVFESDTFPVVKVSDSDPWLVREVGAGKFAAQI